MILWNTRDLQLAADGLGIGSETMEHVAPLGWEHPSLTDDDSFMPDGDTAPGELRPLRTKPSLLAV